MSGFDTTLDVLLASDNRDAPRLLAHVLTRGDMQLRRRTVERLITLTDGKQQSLLVRHFDTLGSELESRVLDRVGQLGPGLRYAMVTREPRMQETVVQIARDTLDQSLAYLVGEAVNSSSESVRAQAVDLLWRWALESRRREMNLNGPAEILLDVGFTRRRKFILEGLQRAFTVRWAAELPRLLRAAAMLADGHASWFWGAMNIRRDARRRVLLASLGERLDPEMFSFVVRGLDREALASEAAGLLDRTFDRRALEALLREFGRQGELSKAALRRLRDMPWLGAGEAALEQLPSALVATALALAAGSGMARRRLAVLCRSVAVNHGEADARRVALDALAHCGDAAGDELAVVAATAPSPSAAGAMLHLVRRGEAIAPSAEMIGNLLRDWWDLPALERREVGRGLTPLLRQHPDVLAAGLAGEGEGRRAAVNLIRLAQVADVYREPLKTLAAETSDTQLQSAALSVVADSMGEGVADVLAQALHSWDGRVRANALEALDRGEAEAAVFLRFTDDPHHRVRANAARALIERGRDEGRQTLSRMLTGSEVERVSALWVFSRTRPDDFVRTAELLSRQDPSRLVRHKAAELLASA